MIGECSENLSDIGDGLILNTVEPEEDDCLWPIDRLSIEPEERLAAKSWRDNGVTIEAITQIYGKNLEKVKEGLKDVSKESKWQCQPQGPVPIPSLFSCSSNNHHLCDHPVIPGHHLHTCHDYHAGFRQATIGL